MNTTMCKKPSIKRIKIETPIVQTPVGSAVLMNKKQTVRPQRKRTQEETVEENKNTSYMSIYL